MWFGSAPTLVGALPVDGFEYSTQAFSERPPYLGFEIKSLNRGIRTDRTTLEIFAGVEEVEGVEGAFDLRVEMTEGGSGGYFPPRLFGKANAVLTTYDAAHL